MTVAGRLRSDHRPCFRAKPAVEVAAMHAGDQSREEFLQKVLAAARTEVMVKALENELGRDHKMVRLLLLGSACLFCWVCTVRHQERRY